MHKELSLKTEEITSLIREVDVLQADLNRCVQQLDFTKASKHETE